MKSTEILIPPNNIDGRGRNGIFDVRRIVVGESELLKTSVIEVYSARTGSSPPISLMSGTKDLLDVMREVVSILETYHMEG